ncbi:small hydrophobic protein [Streptomyces roseirectus]|uniref:Small hydrophobic protein n=1 Tax=Streptomyces roseirectus TaxID=2768066 RepID=A0A7H0IJH4_9ACTN|nr:small hydrophobic protein [Streptomyces roseirectus]QNP72940.1 small hydrophobic protein [Streptomyces roseirectus]
MSGFGRGTRRNPRPRGRMRSGDRLDRGTLGIVGVVFAVAGFFVLGILLGPVAVVCGWLAMGRRWAPRAVAPLVAVVLGALDTLLALLWLAGTPGSGWM